VTGSASTPVPTTPPRPATTPVAAPTAPTPAVARADPPPTRPAPEPTSAEADLGAVAPDDADWADAPWPLSDPLAADAPAPEPAAPPRPPRTTATTPDDLAKASGLDLLRGVFPGRVLRVVASTPNQAAADAPPEPLEPDDATTGDTDLGGPP